MIARRLRLLADELELLGSRVDVDVGVIAPVFANEVRLDEERAGYFAHRHLRHRQQFGDLAEPEARVEIDPAGDPAPRRGVERASSDLNLGELHLHVALLLEIRVERAVDSASVELKRGARVRGVDAVESCLFDLGDDVPVRGLLVGGDVDVERRVAGAYAFDLPE